MKVNVLDAHDRYKHLTKDQALSLNQGAHECLTKNPLSLALQARSPYVYLFAHPRTDDDGVTKRMFWQPRLGRPAPQTNSYLFRAKSHSDLLEICWLLPPREMWDQYKKGKVTESEWVNWSVFQFVNNRKKLADPLPEDFSEEKIKEVLRDIAREMEESIQMKKINSHLPEKFDKI